MRIEIDHSGSVEKFHSILNAMSNDFNIKGVVVFACEANGFSSDLLDPILTEFSLPLVGGIFPAVLHDTEQINIGTIVVGLPYSFYPHIVRSLSCFESNFIELLENTFSQHEIPSTLLLFADGMAKRVASFVQGLFEVLGLGVNYIGGGAGSLTFDQNPCVLSNEGLLVDAVVMAGINVSSSIEVKHGWEAVFGPFKVTESEHNVLKSLDWKPAYEVYKHSINSHSKVQINNYNFDEISKAYPFGIARLFAEPVVRDPAKVDENGNMVCVGEIPEGAFVEILHGEPGALIESASQAQQNCIAKCNGKIELCIFIDCVSRFLFLQDDYQKELEAVQVDHVPLVGALSLGEIANNNEEYLDFHNKTAVVALLESV